MQNNAPAAAAVRKGVAVAHKPIYWPYINTQYFVGLLWHRPGVLQSGGKRSDGGQRTVAACAENELTTPTREDYIVAVHTFKGNPLA